MLQRLKDLGLLLRRDKKTQVVAALILVAIAFVFLKKPPPPRVRPQVVTEEGSGAMGGREAFKDILTAVNESLVELGQKQQKLGEKSVELEQKITENEQRTALIFKKMLEKLAVMEMTRTSTVPAADTVVGVTPEQWTEPVEEMEAFGMETEQPQPPPIPEQRLVFIAPGDTVRVRLLAGVQAPTNGNPYPVLFEVASDIYGPDGAALPVGEARLIAAAEGSLVDQRALFRLTKLSMRLPNGKRAVVPVDGWVAGEDGLRGMSGILIDPIGNYILGAGFAGTIQGVGEGIKDANSTLTTNVYGTTNEFVTGDTWEYAAGEGISRASQQWSAIIHDRVKRMEPVVMVKSGREATAIFAEGVTIPELYEMLTDNNMHFVSLD